MRTFLALTFFALFLSFNSSAAKHSFTNPTDTLKKGKNYNLFSKTDNISNVSFNQNKKKKDIIVVIRLGYPTPETQNNTVGGAVQASKSRFAESEPVPVFDKIEILKGKYENIKVEGETYLKNKFTLSELEFPLHLKLISGKDIIELELLEAGFWNLAIELKK